MGRKKRKEEYPVMPDMDYPMMPEMHKPMMPCMPSMPGMMPGMGMYCYCVPYPMHHDCGHGMMPDHHPCMGNPMGPDMTYPYGPGMDPDPYRDQWGMYPDYPIMPFEEEE